MICKPDFAEQACAICRLGAPDEELAEAAVLGKKRIDAGVERVRRPAPVHLTHKTLVDARPPVGAKPDLSGSGSFLPNACATVLRLSS